ncbi:MAG: hypothetical protein AAF799_10850 [Myxococcota bacterium]
MITTKTIGTALGLVLAAGCTTTELQPAPASWSVEASVYTAAPRCEPLTAKSLVDVLPDHKIDGAVMLDVKNLRRGKLFKSVEPFLEAEARDVLDTMKECGVPLSKVNRVVAGFNEDEDVVFGLEATGVGKDKTLDCLSSKIEAATGEKPWSRVKRGCHTRLETSDADTTGFVVGPNMVVFASKSLEAKLETRLTGKSRSALDGRLSWIPREIDTGRTAWAASRLPPGAMAELGSGMAGANRVGVSIDATKGLDVGIGAGFKTAADAKSAAGEVEGQLAQLRAILPLAGLPSSVGDSFKVTSKGDVMKFTGFLSPSDIEAVRRTVEGLSGGGSEPAPPSRGM